MKKILFVVDGESEGNIIEPATKKLSDSWESKIVQSGSAALGILEDSTFDVIAADIKLPDMGGVDFLKEAANSQPDSIRLIYSEHPNRESILDGAGIVHQYLAKPLNPENFCKVLNCSMGLRQLLSMEELRAKISVIGALPSPPSIYNQLIRELQSEKASIQKVSDLIKKDISITAKLLQIVNSAFFGLAAPVNNPLQAINVLGLETVKGLVLAAAAFNQFKDSDSHVFTLEGIFKRSAAISASARLLATGLGLDNKASDDALIGGMLHDIGKLVLLVHFPRELDAASKLAKEKSILLYHAEREILGVNDAEIGAYLLSLWGLLDTVLESVAWHYEPLKAADPQLNALTCVHLAYAFDYDQSNDSDGTQNSALDMGYLQKMDLVDQIEDLRNLCMGAVI